MPLGVEIIGKNLNPNASNDSDVILEREIDAVMYKLVYLCTICKHDLDNPFSFS